jgi:hypothetical protein
MAETDPLKKRECCALDREGADNVDMWVGGGYMCMGVTCGGCYMCMGVTLCEAPGLDALRLRGAYRRCILAQQ